MDSFVIFYLKFFSRMNFNTSKYVVNPEYEMPELDNISSNSGIGDSDHLEPSPTSTVYKLNPGH